MCATKFDLKEHVMAVHENIKKFKCTVCEQEFAKNWNLQVHVKTEHENMRYPCELCKASYSREGRLKAHMKKYH